jgi:hypothetical protein
MKKVSQSSSVPARRPSAKSLLTGKPGARAPSTNRTSPSTGSCAMRERIVAIRPSWPPFSTR